MRVTPHYLHNLVYWHLRDKLDIFFSKDFTKDKDNVESLFDSNIIICHYTDMFYESSLSAIEIEELGNFIQIFYPNIGSYQVHIKNKSCTICFTFYEDYTYRVIHEGTKVTECSSSEKVLYSDLDIKLDHIQETLSSDKTIDVDMESLFSKIFHKEFDKNLL